MSVTATLDVEEYSAAVMVGGVRCAAAWGPLVDNGEWVVAEAGYEPHRVANRDAALDEMHEIYRKLTYGDVGEPS